MKRPLGAAAACLALVALLAACDDEPTEPKGEVGFGIDEGDQYVAFGDSYTSAPKAGDPAEDAPPLCAQTDVNYPHLIAEATGVELFDNSCNGATTDNVTEQQTNGNGKVVISPPQIDDLDEDTDLVTYRMGANDFSLILRIIGCAAGNAGRLGPYPADYCSDQDAEAPIGSAPDLRDDVATNVASSLEAIRDRAPDAEIIVIGYPQILPPEGSCDQFPLPEGDDAWARAIIDGLNEALRSGADAVGATYVDEFAASEGHDTCSDDPWMAGNKVVGKGQLFHPYPAEARSVADQVLAVLRDGGDS